MSNPTTITETYKAPTGLVGSKTGERYMAAVTIIYNSDDETCRWGVRVNREVTPTTTDFEICDKSRGQYDSEHRLWLHDASSLPAAVEAASAYAYRIAKKTFKAKASKVREARTGHVDRLAIQNAISTIFLGDDPDLFIDEFEV
jgi:hypothetical protein